MDNKPTVGLDYEKEYRRVVEQLKKTELDMQDQLRAQSEGFEKKLIEMEQRFVEEKRKLEADIKFKDEIIKSVLHIRGV